MNADIVLGLFFGDEGKGNTVNWRAQHAERPLIVRFGGGSQCGHTVYHKGRRHVFCSFGSGTFQGAPTHWSKFTAIDPIVFKNERNLIADLNPQVEIHSECKIITPYDKDFNRIWSQGKTDTTGMGFGATIERNEDHYHLLMRDLYYPSILHAKMEKIRDHYYCDRIESKRLDEFFKACKYLKQHTHPVSSLEEAKATHDTLIFEGHQGILLDQHHGFFPHVTRSNTTTKNLWELVKEAQVEPHNIHIYYVMRAYLTRHGDGYMPESELKVHVDILAETNVLNEYQGEFRKALHSSQLIQYALQCDESYHPFILHNNKHIVITCLDQTNNEIYIDDEIIPFEDFGSKHTGNPLLKIISFVSNEQIL